MAAHHQHNNKHQGGKEAPSMNRQQTQRGGSSRWPSVERLENTGHLGR